MERRPEEDAPDAATDSAPDAASVPADATDRDACAKARAYLDLWERHVVLTALNGPVAPWRPAKS